MGVVISVVVLIAVLGALVDIITRPDDVIKGLPKVMWVIVVVFVPLIGCILWFTLGREYNSRPTRGGFAGRWRRKAAAGGAGSATGSGSTPPPVTPGKYQLPTGPAGTEAELAALEREIEFYQKQERIKRLEAELNERERPAE